MLDSLRTIWYFTWRGLLYGAGLGGLAGTFVYPIIGTIFSFAWGGAVGLVMGILLGIGTHFYNRHAYNKQMDFDDYQSSLTTGAGLITAIVTALPLFFLLAPVAGLAAAYVSHRYAEDNGNHLMKRKNDARMDANLSLERKGGLNKFGNYFWQKARYVLFAGMGIFFVLGGLIANSEVPQNLLNTVFSAFGFALGTFIVGSLIIGITSATVGTFLQMLNRVAFSPEWTLEQYKRRAMIFSGLFTLVITPVVGLGIGAPILAIIAALAARNYADWVYEDIAVESAKLDASRLTAEYSEYGKSIEFNAEDDFNNRKHLTM